MGLTKSLPFVVYFHSITMRSRGLAVSGICFLDPAKAHFLRATSLVMCLLTAGLMDPRGAEAAPICKLDTTY